jgi:hypothetical protein
MSSFEKLETTYLSILRAGILVIASLMLVLSVIFSVAGLSKIQIFSFLGGKETPKVDAVEVLNKINKADSGKQDDSEVSIIDGSSQTIENKEDPNAEYYKRYVNAVVAFLQSYSSESVDANLGNRYQKESIYSIIKEMSEQYKDKKVIRSFVSGIVETLESALRDKKIIDMTVNRSAGSVIDDVVVTYVNAFNEKYQKINAENAEKEIKKAEDRSAAVIQLSMAGSSFLIFLLLIFLMIFVKIELNLREMAKSGAR